MLIALYTAIRYTPVDQLHGTQVVDRLANRMVHR